MNDEAHTDQPVLLEAAAIEGFWQAFAYDERNLALLPEQEFVTKANNILVRYAPELALELEHADGSLFKRLVISAHGNTEQFENAMALVRAAPSLPGYKVQAFRTRTLGSDFSMGMDGFELACSDVLVAHYDAGGVVGLELSFEKIIPQDMLDHAKQARRPVTWCCKQARPCSSRRVNRWCWKARALSRWSTTSPRAKAANPIWMSSQPSGSPASNGARPTAACSTTSERATPTRNHPQQPAQARLVQAVLFVPLGHGRERDNRPVFVFRRNARHCVQDLF